MQRIKNIDAIIDFVVNIDRGFKKGDPEISCWDDLFLRELEKKRNDLKHDFFSAFLKKNLIGSYRYEESDIDGIKKLYLQKLYTEWWIHCCPYCGKNTIIHFWIEDEKFERLYDIEHFLSRGKYPSLSINLYNRLPACMSCNQRLKKTIDPLEKTKQDNKIYHPYFWWIYKAETKNLEKVIEIGDKDFDSKMTFIKSEQKNEEGGFILTSHHGKTFQLANIYLNSEDTFQIFRFIYDKYTKIKDEYLKFKKRSKSIEAFMDYFFASYYPKDEQDILKYSNGKYKKDLIQYMRKLLESWKQTLPDQN